MERGWLWLLRLHPYYRDDRHWKHTAEFLRAHDVGNCEIDGASDSVLYPLLEHCQHHVCFGSSTYHGALGFKVPTTMIDPNSLIYFQEDHARGRFTYADRADTLLDSVQRGFVAGYEADGSDYICSDRERPTAAMRAILSSESAPRGWAL